MSEASVPPEPRPESGWWIAAKVALFVAIPFLLIYMVKLFVR
jgi:hypothetical protein